MYNLQVRDLQWASGRVTLILRNTQTGQRKGAEEMVFCQSSLATKWLRRICRSLPPTAFILDRSPDAFRSLFFNLLDYLQVPGHISLYSIRRGGATWHFMAEQSLETTLLRGRWQSTSTARIYLQDSAAALAHLQITALQRTFLRQLCRYL